jgi:hypothetical protein
MITDLKKKYYAITLNLRRHTQHNFVKNLSSVSVSDATSFAPCCVRYVHVPALRLRILSFSPATLTTKTIRFALPLRIFARIVTLENKLKCADLRGPCGLRRESAAARLLGLRVRIPPGCMDVCLS